MENNWIRATGIAKPNFQNTSDKNVLDQVWSIRTNVTGNWLLSWTFEDGLRNPNSSLTGNTAIYQSLSVKHVGLQVPQSQMFLVNSISGTLDVLTYWWLNPKDSPDPNFVRFTAESIQKQLSFSPPSNIFPAS